MSAIDCFRHDLLGALGRIAQIPVYRFRDEAQLERARREYECESLEVGDILIGGGSGEHSEFIIHMKALEAYLLPFNPDDFVDWADCYTNHWSMDEVVAASSNLPPSGFNSDIHRLPEWLVVSVLNHLLKMKDVYPTLSEEAWTFYLEGDHGLMEEEDRRLVHSILFLLDFCPYVSRFENLTKGHVAYEPLYPPNAVRMPHPWTGANGTAPV